MLKSVLLKPLVRCESKLHQGKNIVFFLMKSNTEPKLNFLIVSFSYSLSISYSLNTIHILRYKHHFTKYG